MYYVKRGETIYEIIHTPSGAHINVYNERVWIRKVFVPRSEFRKAES